MDYQGVMMDLLAMYHRATSGLAYVGPRAWEHRNFATDCLMFFYELRER